MNMPFNLDPRWLELEERFKPLVDRIHTSQTDPERRGALRVFFKSAESVLKTHRQADEMKVFCEAAYLLSTKTCSEDLWKWLRKIASSSDDRRKQMMKEAILELIPEPPVNRSDLINLWRM